MTAAQEAQERADLPPVLILGNGISRLSYESEIAAFPGELWATNRAYVEPEIGPRLARLTGHRDVMLDALDYRAKHGLSFEVWSGRPERKLITAARPFTCDSRFLRDSGTTLVAQALHEGRRVTVAGFDLGGPDIHSPGLWRQCKRGWVDRWAQLFGLFGRDCVEWIGHDHSDFIDAVRRKKAKATDYSRRYLKRLPHIPGPEYFSAWRWYMNASDAESAAARRGEVLKIKVRYNNGRETFLNDDVARIFEKRGRVKILEPIEAVTASGAPVEASEASEELAAPKLSRRARRADG